MAARAKRTIKPPKKFESSDDETEVKAKKAPTYKFVYRILKREDVTKNLKDEEVFVRWPDNGLWYAATISKLTIKTLDATLDYEETGEKEKTNLAELIKDGDLALKEKRPRNHKLLSNERAVPADEDVEGEEGAESQEGSNREESQGTSPEKSGQEDGDDDDVPDAAAIEEESSGEDEELKSRVQKDEGGDESPNQEKPSLRSPKASAAPPQTPSSTERAAQKKRRVEEDAVPGRGSGSAGDKPAVKRAKLEGGRSEGQEALEAKRSTKPRKTDDDDDEVLKAERAAKQMLKNLARGASSDSFYGEKHKAGGQPKPKTEAPKPKPTGASDPEMRAKVLESLTAALAVAEKEMKTEGHTGDLPDPVEVGKAVEEEMFKLHGNAGKEYRWQARSLGFNLKDPANPDLRARVLNGELTPHSLVRLQGADLASKELSQWRKKKEEEALKATVLDDVTAARFSTAAAQAARKHSGLNTVDWRNSSIRASPPRERTPEVAKAPNGGHNGSANAAHVPLDPRLRPSPAQPAPYSPTHAASHERGQQNGVEAAAAAPKSIINWTNIKAQIRENEVTHPTAPAPFEGFGDFSAFAVNDEGHAGANGMEAQDRDFRGGDDMEIDDPYPSEMRVHGPSQSPPESPAEHAPVVEPLHHHMDLTGVITSSSGRKPEVWGGSITVQHGLGSYHLVADYLAGAGDVGALLSEDEIKVKGNIQMERLEHYIRDLKHSKNRTISIATMRTAASHIGEEMLPFRELVEHYRDKSRAMLAFVGPAPPHEVYLVPPCELANALLKCAKKAAGPEMEVRIPAAVSGDQLLAVVIHRKDWQPGPDYKPRDLRAMPAPRSPAASLPSPAHPNPSVSGVGSDSGPSPLRTLDTSGSITSTFGTGLEQAPPASSALPPASAAGASPGAPRHDPRLPADPRQNLRQDPRDPRLAAAMPVPISAPQLAAAAPVSSPIDSQSQLQSQLSQTPAPEAPPASGPLPPPALDTNMLNELAAMLGVPLEGGGGNGAPSPGAPPQNSLPEPRPPFQMGGPPEDLRPPEMMVPQQQQMQQQMHQQQQQQQQQQHMGGPPEERRPPGMMIPQQQQQHMRPEAAPSMGQHPGYQGGPWEGMHRGPQGLPPPPPMQPSGGSMPLQGPLPPPPPPMQPSGGSMPPQGPPPPPLMHPPGGSMPPHGPPPPPLMHPPGGSMPQHAPHPGPPPPNMHMLPPAWQNHNQNMRPGPPPPPRPPPQPALQSPPRPMGPPPGPPPGPRGPPMSEPLGRPPQFYPRPPGQGPPSGAYPPQGPPPQPRPPHGPRPPPFGPRPPPGGPQIPRPITLAPPGPRPPPPGRPPQQDRRW